MRQRMAFEIGVACVVLWLLVRFVYQPLLGTLHQTRAALRDLRVNIADARGVVERGSDHQALLQREQERYRAIKGRIDKSQSVARVIEALRAEARRCQLHLSAVQPRANPDSLRTFAVGTDTMLRETLLTLRLSGPYRQVGEFLGALLEQPFLVYVRHVTITTPEVTGQGLQAELSLAVYLPERSGSHDLAGKDDHRS